jgi:tetratricopeptide (TPR) repeat protein
MLKTLMLKTVAARSSTSRVLTPALAAIVALTLLAGTPALAAGNKKPKDAEEDVMAVYEKGKKASDAGEFEKALGIFEKAHEMDPKNPDVLNMLAYTQRKNGKIDQAIENYHRALELRPKFPEAREYLGEAYIQAALREIKTLESYGDEADHELEELVEAFKAAASGL